MIFKDINNQEIKDGDIVKVTDCKWNDYEIYEIKYRNDDFWVIAHGETVDLLLNFSNKNRYDMEVLND